MVLVQERGPKLRSTRRRELIAISQIAVDEARRFRHQYIGEEHFILALMRSGTVDPNLAMHGIVMPDRMERAREFVEYIVGENTVGILPLRQISPSAKKVIDSAKASARKRHRRVRGEDILYEFTKDQTSITNQMIDELSDIMISG